MNKVILCGNIGNDPDLQYTKSNTPVCNMSLATTKKWISNDGDQQQKTSWHSVSIFGKTAENCAKYLRKGDKILVTGEIDYQKYEKDGETRHVAKILAQNIEFLTKKHQEDIDSGRDGSGYPPDETGGF